MYWVFGGGALLIALLLIFSMSNKEQTENAYYAKILAHRAAKTAQFQTENSPLPAEERKGFKSLNYFDIDSSYALNATFTREKASQPINNNMEPNSSLIKAGVILFTFQSKNYQLTAYWQSNDNEAELFVPFRDGTTGKSTYGGGRFLNVELNGNAVKLDFNLCYNPYCAYNPAYTCPIPPPENTLPFAIPVGEKNWKQPI